MCCEFQIIYGSVCFQYCEQVLRKMIDTCARDLSQKMRENDLNKKPRNMKN